MLRFGVAKPQNVLLLTMKRKCAEKKIDKKSGPKLDSNPVPLLVTACEPSALPSELQRSVNWAAHTYMASVV